MTKLIYPFCHFNSKVIMEIIEIFKENNENFLIASFKGSRYINQEVGLSSNYHNSPTIIIDLETINLDSVCEIIYLETEENKQLSRDYFRYCIEGKINIPVKYCIGEIKEINRNSSQLLSEYNDDSKQLFKKFPYHFEPTIPIVAVGGMFEMDDNQRIIFALRRSMKKKGLNAAVLINSNNASFVDGFYLGDTMTSLHVNFVEKVVVLNSAIKKINKLRKYDILILEIPSGIGRINSSILNSYGEWYHIISEAVGVDYYIFNAELQFADEELVEDIKTELIQRFDIFLEAVIISNCYYIGDSKYIYNSKVPHVHTGNVCEIKYTAKMGGIICGGFNDKTIEEVCCDIITKCTGNK